MKEFFIYTRPNEFYRMSFLEQIIPIVILIIMIMAIYLFRDRIKKSKKVEKYIRYTMGALSCIIFIMYYLSIWIIEGIKSNNLPLHLCYITNILCIILAFTKNKRLFNFAIFAGVLGGISSLVSVDVSLSAGYFK